MLNHFVHDEEVLLLRKTDKPTWTMDSSAKQVGNLVSYSDSKLEHK